ncbi:MAG: hypothetical protein PHX83_00590 [Acidobacteriia bacterium]|nr:hypothetical protein [Terriglobia bacterium]
MGRPPWAAVAFCILIIMLAGSSCAPTEPYINLAEAGVTYAQAMDKLLDACIDISVNATSERMLQNKLLATPTLADYNAQTQVDRDRIIILRRLQSHARLMGEYFQALNDLAASKAPSQIADSIGSIVDPLNALGQELRGSDLLKNKGAVATGTQLVVGSIIRGRLRRELEQRKDTIDGELQLQAELLKALAGAMDADLKQISEIQEQRLVIKPLIDSRAISNPDQWVAARHRFLTTPQVSQELNGASEAVSRLRLAFEESVAGSLNRDRVKGLLADFGSILEFAESLKR